MSFDPMSESKQELAALRRRGGITLSRALLALGVLLIAIIAGSSLFDRSGDTWRFDRIRTDLSTSGAPWALEFVDRQQYFSGWLQRHGTSFEVRTFDRVSTALAQSAGAFGGYSSRESGFFSRATISLHLGLLRISFILLACWRLWAVAIVCAALWGASARQPHEADDILGQSGNGRLFFSGARADLKSNSPSGAPDLQIRGLACPATIPANEARSSEIGKILEAHQALNETNTALAAIILKHAEVPAYVPAIEEEALLNECFVGAGLAEAAAYTLKSALLLREHYAKKDGATADPAFLTPGKFEVPEGKMTHSVYTGLLRHALHRVLTPAMREELKEISPAELATLILSLEAGKVLAFRRESGKWLKKSTFPQLSARAVLHSVASFGKEYDYDRRSLIRRGLVYGSRQSAFGSVRFPIDMSAQTRAARQWVELLMAAPHSLQSTADEVELFGLVGEMHGEFSQRFLDSVVTAEDDTITSSYSTPGNLLVVPIKRVLLMMKKFVDSAHLRRLEELVTLVSQRQRLRVMSLDFVQDGEARGALPSYERIFPPLTHAQIKTLATDHGLTPAEVREWSSLRVVLNSFGWLGRRVGDYTVPESSIIFAVLKADPNVAGRNALGLIGRPGMVALRATRIEARLGKLWRQRFTQVQSAAMAEDTEHYKRLLDGIEDTIQDDSFAANGATVGV